jgi:phospholipid-translocating ATPase
MPTNAKAMQRFLGVAVFFNEFIPCYSDVTAKLYDMIKPTFSWDQKTWKEDYNAIYEKVKIALANSTAKYFPNYELDWILRTDASITGCSAVLLQIDTDPSRPTYQPIGFKSKKFTEAATRWDTHKQEAYAVFFGVKNFAYFLYAKKFVIETDHRNLLWMESSDASIVVRWRVFLQSFNFMLRDIKGKDNIVADWGSRLYSVAEDSSEETTDEVAPSDDVSRVEFYFSKVHGGRMFHPGVREHFGDFISTFQDMVFRSV